MLAVAQLTTAKVSQWGIRLLSKPRRLPFFVPTSTTRDRQDKVTYMCTLLRKNGKEKKERETTLWVVNRGFFLILWLLPRQKPEGSINAGKQSH